MKNKFLIGIIVLYVVISVVVLLKYDGTGDTGDSVLHYLFAKFAPNHLELYFNHWAKPLYVLLASPFAQFGIIGIKIFNCINFGLTIFFTFKIAELFQLKNKALTFLFLIAAPLYFTLTFSGLTEPLFAMFLSLGIYLVLKEKLIFAVILFSFLPFVRSEGLIVLAVIGFYLLLIKAWKLLPFLLVGHVVYSIAGYFYYHDIFWVFTKIPYSNLGSPYGSGKLFHFFENLIYVIGVPIYILFWIGILVMIIQFFKMKIELKILYLFLFIVFISAHSIFWYFGIFNSMGLIRVLVAISPITAIVSLIGFNTLTEELIPSQQYNKRIIQAFVISYIVIFPFTSNPGAIHPKKDLMLWEEQRAAKEVGEFLNKKMKNTNKLYYSYSYLSEVLNIDHFDVTKRANLIDFKNHESNKGDLVIWDNWFSIVEENMDQSVLNNHPRLIKIFEVNTYDQVRKREINFCVYEVNED